MDLDAYVAAHSVEWTRLEQLTRSRQLQGAAADELVDRIQQVSTQLSVIRSVTPDASLVSYLSGVLAAARARTVGTRTASWRTLPRFFTHTFPAALYVGRRWWLGTMIANLLVAFGMGWWLYDHPRFESSLLSPEQINQLVHVDFAHYYSQYAASHFAAHVWTNNAWIAAVCIALGVFGLPVIYLLFQNLANLAVIGAIMIRHHRGDLFFGLILPHGMLELTAVFVAAGFGLRTFWSWVEPGEHTRLQSLARSGRVSVGVAIGLVVVLFISGLIEAFVTPSGLPTWARIAIGAVAWSAFMAYALVLGKRAVSAGETGDLDVIDLEDTVQIAV